MKRNLKRRYLATGAATVFAVAVSVPVVAALADEPAADYELTALPGPDEGDGTVATHVDPTGEYVAGYAYEGNLSTPLLWKDGEYEVVELPEETGYLNGVNSSGLAVGSYNNADDEKQVFTYQDGEVQEVGHEFR